jgi:hypothetical protein
MWFIFADLGYPKIALNCRLKTRRGERRLVPLKNGVERVGYLLKIGFAEMNFGVYIKFYLLTKTTKNEKSRPAF